MNPYVFFVGCPRSGTTLLERIADAHPELAVIHETRWIARTFASRRGLTPEGMVTARLLGRIRNPKRLNPLRMDEATLARAFPAGDGVHFSQFVTRLFDLYGEREGKHLVGDKSPGYVRYLPLLHDLWPWARFVHIIRDGRDVCLSVRDWRKGATGFSSFEDDPFTTTGIWWEWYVRLGREGGRQLGPGLYHELRYESLVAEPERETARLCAFLGIPYDAAMLRFHEGRLRDDPRLDAKKAWRPVTPGLRSWRTQMPAADIARFEAAAGDLLDELGLDRAERSASEDDLARVERLRQAFAATARARRWPVPSAWQQPAEVQAEGAR